MKQTELTYFQIPNGGIILQTGYSMKIVVLEYHWKGWNGWQEIEFYGIEETEMIDQLIWKAGNSISSELFII